MSKISLTFLFLHRIVYKMPVENSGDELQQIQGRTNEIVDKVSLTKIFLPFSPLWSYLKFKTTIVLENYYFLILCFV